MFDSVIQAIVQYGSELSDPLNPTNIQQNLYM